MSQWGLPISDVSKGTNAVQCSGLGDGDADAYDELDEGLGAGRGSGSGPDDAGTVWNLGGTAGGDANGHIECLLGSVTDPAVSTGHIFKIRVTKSSTCGTPLGTGQQTDLTYLLKQGGTTIATTTVVDYGTGGVYTTEATTLSGGQADSITNYADLRIRAFYVQVGGGSARRCNTSAYEFECPDAAAADTLFAQSCM